MGKLFRPKDKLSQARYVGINTFMKLPLVENVEDLENDDKADFAIVGYPEDGGCSFRPGQRFAPNYIRRFSEQMRPYNEPLDVNIYEELQGFDNGDINVAFPYSEHNFNLAVEKLTALAERGIIPITLGGDHMITAASLKAMSDVYGKIGLIHFDSHTDTWPSDAYGGTYNNGTSLYKGVTEGWIDPERTISIGIKGTLFQRGEWNHSTDLGIKLITMSEFEKIGVEETVRQIKERVGDGPTFLTFDLDCVDAAYAPGGALYEPDGFTGREVFGILNNLTGINYVGFDFAELVPDSDNQGGITGYLAAAIIQTFIAHVGVMKRNK